MLVIANLGKFLAELLKAGNRNLLKSLKCLFCRRNNHPSKKALLTKLDENGNEIENVGDGSTPFGLFFAFILYIGKDFTTQLITYFLVIGSVVISFYEPDMDFFKAIYFNFITLTVGLALNHTCNSYF
jgi:hypothetical protein